MINTCMIDTMLTRYNDKYMYDGHNVNKDKENMLGVLRQMLGIM